MSILEHHFCFLVYHLRLWYILLAKSRYISHYRRNLNEVEEWRISTLKE